MNDSRTPSMPTGAALAIDTHAHIVDPRAFAYSPAAPYHPEGGEIGPLASYLDVLDVHAITHAVIVQPTSGYRFDNAITLDAIAGAGGRLRGILRIDPKRARADVALLDREHVAGVRFDVMGEGEASMQRPETRWLLDALAERDQVAVVQVERDQLCAALPVLREARVRLCIDHCGRPDPARGVAQPGFAALLELGREGHAIKLSGPFRYSRERPPFRDVRPFVEAILASFGPDQCCWGSDWPYLRAPFRIDYGPELALLAEWVPNAHDRARILGRTPSRVFGFDAGTRA